MHLAFCDFALVLFLAGIALYSTFHIKLSWFFILLSVLPLHPSLYVIIVRAVAPLNGYFIPFFRQQCLAAEDKTAFFTLMVTHTA